MAPSSIGQNMPLIMTSIMLNSLRETKMVNLTRQVESGGFHAMKWAPRRSSYKCERLMFEAIHGQTFQNNNCQILTELQIDKNMKVLGPKWDVKEIQVCKDLLQGKCLMLEGAKKIIIIVVAKNDEAIVFNYIRKFSYYSCKSCLPINFN
jgi:hypothetical protein